MRINSVTHHEGLKDLLALRSYPVKPDVVMVPKVESPRDLEIVEQSLGPDCAHMDLMAIVETARGLENVNAISCSISAPSSGDGGGPTEGEPLLGRDGGGAEESEDGAGGVGRAAAQDVRTGLVVSACQPSRSKMRAVV